MFKIEVEDGKGRWSDVRGDDGRNVGDLLRVGLGKCHWRLLRIGNQRHVGCRAVR